MSFIFDVFSVKRLDSYFQQDVGEKKELPGLAQK